LAGSNREVSTTRPDVLIVGAGPAGAIAAGLLARAGARVRLIDRARFPRDKLCGDTLNPGTLSRLHRLGLESAAAGGLPLDGMLVTGEHDLRVEGRYPAPLHGRSMLRRDLDQRLVELACRAGTRFDEAVTARRALVEGAGSARRVDGIVAASQDGTEDVRARVTIAADGRRSTLAFALGLARHPVAPRRWAVGAYFQGVRALSSLGEMHIRRGYYVGVAPLPGALANICVVAVPGSGTILDPCFRDPRALLAAAIEQDPVLRDRCAGSTLSGGPIVLGPLAVDRIGAGIDGLFLAGDAGGFIDPMTGDGLHFAVRDAELVAEATLEVLASGWAGAHQRLARRRARALGAKRQLNRVLRAVVGSSSRVGLAGAIVARAPGLVRTLVRVAGDTWDA
jgi:flavin-dependent dehydrogenase